MKIIVYPNKTARYFINDALSVGCIHDSKVFYIVYYFNKSQFAKSYLLKKDFIENKLQVVPDPYELGAEDRYIVDFLAGNPEIKNQIRKILKYHDIL